MADSSSSLSSSSSLPVMDPSPHLLLSANRDPLVSPATPTCQYFVSSTGEAFVPSSIVGMIPSITPLMTNNILLSQPVFYTVAPIVEDQLNNARDMSPNVNLELSIAALAQTIKYDLHAGSHYHPNPIPELGTNGPSSSDLVNFSPHELTHMLSNNPIPPLFMPQLLHCDVSGSTPLLLLPIAVMAAYKPLFVSMPPSVSFTMVNPTPVSTLEPRQT